MNCDLQELIDEQDHAGSEIEYAMDSNASLTEVFVLLSEHLSLNCFCVLISLFLPLYQAPVKKHRGAGGGWVGAEHLKIKAGVHMEAIFWLGIMV